MCSVSTLITKTRICFWRRQVGFFKWTAPSCCQEAGEVNTLLSPEVGWDRDVLLVFSFRSTCLYSVCNAGAGTVQNTFLFCLLGFSEDTCRKHWRVPQKAGRRRDTLCPVCTLLLPAIPLYPGSAFGSGLQIWLPHSMNQPHYAFLNAVVPARQPSCLRGLSKLDIVCTQEILVLTKIYHCLRKLIKGRWFILSSYM